MTASKENMKRFIAGIVIFLSFFQYSYIFKYENENIKNYKQYFQYFSRHCAINTTLNINSIRMAQNKDLCQYNKEKRFYYYEKLKKELVERKFI